MSTTVLFLFRSTFLVAAITACGSIDCFGQSLQSKSDKISPYRKPASEHSHRAFEGDWAYRSFRSNPDLAVEPNDLLFGSGTLVLDQNSDTTVSGTLGGDGWSLQLTGSADIGSPPTVRFQGRGEIGGEEWVYDYAGYLVPKWPNGVEQRPAIVGTIVRTKEHSQGQAEAGYVAQWIAVLKDPAAAADKSSAPAHRKQPKTDNTRSATPFNPAVDNYLDELKGLPKRLEAAETAPKNATAKSSSRPFQPFSSPKEIRSSSGTLDTELTLAYADHEIWNPSLGQSVTFRHRSYNGQLIGDTLRVAPGDVLRVLVRNQLPVESPHQGPINEPHGFNVSNLHTHGLHVSPAGNSDNVFAAIQPGAEFQNEIYVPTSHAAGTFWYHAHVHGSTAIQVSSGMAGALIVEGGVDTVPSVAAAKEDVLVFQQIPYTKSQSADVFELESYDTFGPGDWDPGTVENGWRTLISGQYCPLFSAAPGQVMRWRMIDAGLREDVDVSVLRYEDAVRFATERSSEELKDVSNLSKALSKAKEEIDTASIPLYEIAADGLAYGRIWARPSIPMSPGYRSDILLQLQDAGLYVVIDREATAAESLHATHNAPKLLGIIVVSGDRVEMNLPTNEEMQPYLPHKSITDAEINKSSPQAATFNIDVAADPTKYQINSQEFDSSRPARRLVLGEATEWALTSDFVNHPFHIHVNPFEIISMIDANGDEQLPVDTNGKIMPIWKDTILVQEGHLIRVRMRHEDYIGKFVLHCHILDHEDRGMMESVEIIVPGGPHGH